MRPGQVVPRKSQLVQVGQDRAAGASMRPGQVVPRK